MLFILLFAAAWGACLAKCSSHYSYSLALGHGIGSGFSSSGEGYITAVRVWELTNSYITGCVMAPSGTRFLGANPQQSLNLFEGEAIVQVSGKYNPSNYIYQLIFATNRGRSLFAGLSFKTSFNFYPTHEEAELMILSGRFNGNGITSLGAHWGIINS